MDNSEKKVLDNLINKGVHVFGEIIDANAINKLYEKMKNARNFGKGMFLSEDEYLIQNSHLNANPEDEYNFLIEFESELDLIEKNNIIKNNIVDILGADFEIVVKKVVCGVPDNWLPEWVRREISGVNVANLGAFIKPEFRDITYFRGIDFHQDIIDYPKGKTCNDPSTFMTLYVYLHDVTLNDSPLHVLPNSHEFGATIFPHNLALKHGNIWEYSDAQRSMECEDLILEGGGGYAAIWHNCTLHGTQPVNDENDSMRLSLRYLISKKRSNNSKTGIDLINNCIDGELSPKITRSDLDEKGKAKVKGNVINHY